MGGFLEDATRQFVVAFVAGPILVIQRHERRVVSREVFVRPDCLAFRWRAEDRTVVAHQRTELSATAVSRRDSVQGEPFLGVTLRTRQHALQPAHNPARFIKMIRVKQRQLIQHQVILGTNRAGKTLHTRAVAARWDVCVAEKYPEVKSGPGIPQRQIVVRQRYSGARVKCFPPLRGFPACRSITSGTSRLGLLPCIGDWIGILVG